MHPTTTGVDWTLDEMIFDAGKAGIAIAMFQRNRGTETSLGFRWLSSPTASTYFGKESEWILLPFDFAVDAARRLIEKKAAGMSGIEDKGFHKMVEWLKYQEEIIIGIGY